MQSFIAKFIQNANLRGWIHRVMPNELALIRDYKGSQQKMYIRWQGDAPVKFEVKTSLIHPKYGKTTLTRGDLKKEDVFKLISNPRYHTKTDVSRYDHNIYLQTKEAMRKATKNRREIGSRPPKKKKRKESTGEKALFVRIWNKRKHFSEISGKPLKPIDHPQWINQFMHVLPKSLYEHYRLLEENIVLGTPEEHFKQTNQIHLCQGDPQWDGFFLKLSILKERYHEEFPTRSKRIE